jgi:predicted transcriptional regulator
MLSQLLMLGLAGALPAQPRLTRLAPALPVAVTSGARQLSASVQQLLAHRSELKLDDEQIRRLQALADVLRHQESDWYLAARRRASSKPWIYGHAIGSAEEARAEAFSVLRPEQRRLAEQLLPAPAGRVEP